MTCLIGIPTLNGPDRLKRCLAAICECTDLTDVRVLVADDGSSPTNLEANKDLVGAFGFEMLMTGGARLGVAAEWNRLVRHAPSDVIVLVNDDVEVVEDWLSVLRFSVEENPLIGCVSLRSVTGTIKAAAAPIPLRIDYQEARLLLGGGGLVTAGGACFAFRRAVYDEVGGFDERFFCFYEEVDFSVAARECGYYSAFASYPLVYHLGGATTSESKNMDAQRILVESRQKFHQKWGKTPAQIRQSLVSVPPLKGLREWNMQMKVLVD